MSLVRKFAGHHRHSLLVHTIIIPSIGLLLKLGEMVSGAISSLRGRFPDTEYSPGISSCRDSILFSVGKGPSWVSIHVPPLTDPRRHPSLAAKR